MPYIGKSTTIGVRQRYMYTATSSQTTFSGTDTQNLTLTYTDSNFVDVYLNGVLLKTGTDYTATSGTSVVLASGAAADDIVEIIVYDTFAVANFYNRTDSDSRYVNIDGDTMTGSLDLNGTELVLDVDGDSSITADTDDQIDVKLGGSDRISVKASGSTSVDLNAGGSMKLTVGGSDSHQFINGSDTVMVIDSSGNIGFGTATPSTNFNTNRNNLVISDASSAGITLNSTATDGSSIISMTDGTGTLAGEIHYVHDTNYMMFKTVNTEAMRINNNQNLLIGHTDNISIEGGNQALQLTGTTSNDGISIARFNADFGPYLNFGRSGSGTIGTMTAVPNNDEVGRIQWAVADGTDMASVGASISAFTEQLAASNDVPCRLVFSTTADSGTSPTERMRIDSSGNVGIGATPLTLRSDQTGLQLGGNFSIMAETSTSADNSFNLSQNAHFDGAWKYISTDEASNYYQSAGQHNFRVAASGTAGNTVSWTTALTISSGGDATFSGGVDCAEITYDKVSDSAGNSGLNVSAQYSYDDNNENSIGSNFHSNHTFIYITTNAGFTVVPVLSNGGAGIAWANYLWDPDGQSWGSANDMTFTQSGTSGNTFRIRISAGTGVGTIERTSGSMAYQVYVSRPAGGS